METLNPLEDAIFCVVSLPGKDLNQFGKEEEAKLPFLC